MFAQQTVKVFSPFTSHFSRKRTAFTLAEVFHPAEQSKKIAFTLAEVLITLGIIGVVAALTMPTLIAKYQKRVNLTKLKKNYSLLSQALYRAQVDYGSMDTWELINGEDLEGANYEKRLTEFMQTHFLNYMSVSKDCGYQNVNKCPIGKTANYYYYFITSDGAVWNVLINNERRQDGKLYSNGQFLFGLEFDRLKNSISYGKDAFLISVYKNKIEMYHSSGGRNAALNNCKTGNRRSCGWLIQTNGWEYPPDYPW